jgi:hypothetical protein
MGLREDAIQLQKQNRACLGPWMEGITPFGRWLWGVLDDHAEPTGGRSVRTKSQDPDMGGSLPRRVLYHR